MLYVKNAVADFYGQEVLNTTNRCPNGYMWETGDFPYLEVECLNKKWSRKSLPECKSESPGPAAPSREVLWAGRARGLSEDGRVVAVQEAPAGGQPFLRLPQPDDDLGL